MDTMSFQFLIFVPTAREWVRFSNTVWPLCATWYLGGRGTLNRYKASEANVSASLIPSETQAQDAYCRKS